MSKTSAELISEMNDIIAAADAARKKMIDKGSKCFEKYLSALFDEIPELNLIVIRGWTPGFNDGDACTHSQDVMVSQDDFSDYGYDEDDYDSDEDSDEDEDSEPKAKKGLNADLPKAKAREIQRNLQSFDDVLESMYDTNWQLTAKRQPDGKMKLEQTEYDCGH